MMRSSVSVAVTTWVRVRANLRVTVAGRVRVQQVRVTEVRVRGFRVRGWVRVRFRVRVWVWGFALGFGPEPA